MRIISENIIIVMLLDILLLCVRRKLNIGFQKFSKKPRFSACLPILVVLNIEMLV